MTRFTGTNILNPDIVVMLLDSSSCCRITESEQLEEVRVGWIASELHHS
jgi:hypothetical protein